LERTEQMALDVRALQRVHPELAAEELDSARRELLRAQRGVLRSLQRDGVISEEVFATLITEIDAGLTGDDPLATEVLDAEDEEGAVDP